MTLEYSSAWLAAAPVLLCGLSLAPCSILIGELLQSPDQITFALPLLVFVAMLPGALYFDLAFEIQRTSSVELILSLSPPSAMALALRNLCRLESLHMAGGWHTTSPISEVPYYYYSLMLLLDNLFYSLALVVYLEWLQPNLSFKHIRCSERYEEDGLLSDNTVLSVHRLFKRYGRCEVLSNISTHLHEGEVTVLLGSNGAGKTTLMRIFSGLDREFQGFVKLHSSGDPKKRKIGWCPQSDALWSYLTVLEHVVIFSALLHMKQTELTDALTRLNMQQHMSKRVKRLSGGLKRRLSLVLAYAGDPPLVCIDEATTGCDYKARELMRQEILKRRESSSTLISTHHIDDIEVRTSCDYFYTYQWISQILGRIRMIFINDKFLAYDGAGDNMVGDHVDNVQFSTFDVDIKARFRSLFGDESFLCTELPRRNGDSMTTWTIRLENNLTDLMQVLKKSRLMTTDSF